MKNKPPKRHAGAKRADDHSDQVLLTYQISLVVRTALGIFGSIGLAAFFSALSSAHVVWAPWIGVLTAAIYLPYFYLHFTKRVREKKSIQQNFKLLFSITVAVSIGVAIVIHRDAALIFSNPSPPELLLDARVSSFVPGKPATITSLVNNTGGTTAYKINLCSETTIEPSSFKGPLQYGTPPPNAEKTIPPLLPPRFNALMVSTSRANELTMSRKWIEALTNKQASFFYFGRGEYFDQDGRSYPAEFCFLYDPAAVNGLMAICPQQYWPRKQDFNRNCPPS